MYAQWTFISHEEQNLTCAAKWIELNEDHFTLSKLSKIHKIKKKNK